MKSPGLRKFDDTANLNHLSFTKILG
jgi:hypothetical protein